MTFRQRGGRSPTEGMGGGQQPPAFYNPQQFSQPQPPVQQAQFTPQLFEDTSSRPQQQQPPQQYASFQPPPGTSQYGGYQPQNFQGFSTGNAAYDQVGKAVADGIFNSGQDGLKTAAALVERSGLRSYFDVDTSYVTKKLLILMAPYVHKTWPDGYTETDSRPTPKNDVNSPDLYIPLMAFITYLLVGGWTLGMQQRFTTDELGTKGSTCLGSFIFEVLLLLLISFIIQIQMKAAYLDLIALCGYKYVPMIAVLLSGVFFGSFAYYAAIAVFGTSIAVYMIRYLRGYLKEQTDRPDHTFGRNRKAFFLILLAVLQPVLMWLLTRGVVFAPPSAVVPPVV